jgi:hypothetical protein
MKGTRSFREVAEETAPSCPHLATFGRQWVILETACHATLVGDFLSYCFLKKKKSNSLNTAQL